MNLEEYFARIGFEPQGAPNAELLATLMTHHLRSLPFENIDVLLGRPISLEPQDIYEKIVVNRRGGYCHEHNTLFDWVLTELGYKITTLAARVRRGSTAPRAYSHKILRVDIEEVAYLVDVGFGGEGARAPMPLGSQHRDGDLVHHLRADPAGLWVLSLGELDLYAFDLQPHRPVDYAMYNHFSATYPKSHFLHGLTVQLHTQEGFKILSDRSLRNRTHRGFSEHTIGSAAELRQVLQDEFGLANIAVEELPHPVFP